MNDIVIIAVASAIGAGLATSLGAAIGAWMVGRHWTREQLAHMQRALTRETAKCEADNAAARTTVARLRAHRNELLRVAEMARSALLETQIEARAREEQIRRAARDSGFGNL